MILRRILPERYTIEHNAETDDIYIYISSKRALSFIVHNILVASMIHSNQNKSIYLNSIYSIL